MSDETGTSPVGVADAVPAPSLVAMERILGNAVGALALRRGTYRRLLWDEYATADAILVVVVASAARLAAAVVAGRYDALDLIQGMLRVTTGELIRWMVAALVLWLISTKVFRGHGRIPAAVGLTGYAYLPFVLAPVVEIGLGLAGSSRYATAVVVGASIWFGLGLLIIAQELFDLARDKAVGSAALSVLGWWVVTLII